MTQADRTEPRQQPNSPRGVLAAVAESRFALWVAFVLVHLWLGLVNLYGPGLPLGDVTIMYKFWSDQAFSAHYIVGIDGPFVYPIIGLVPMLLAAAFGASVYASTWLSLIMLLNAVALASLSGWGREKRNVTAGWWWTGFLLLLGPIALGRIDAVTVPLAVVGVLLLATRPVAASFVLTIATWIKVWPAALLAAIVIASRHRMSVAGWAAIASGAIIAIALAYGSGLNVFSFITQQTGRGLQAEAPVSTIWLWLAAFGVPGAAVEYNLDILTYQVTGPGADAASTIMTGVLAIAALATAALGIVAARRRVPALDLLPVLSLALVSCLIAFNKVGSPQFISWLAVPVIFGIVLAARGGISFRTPAILVLAIAVLTQTIYPYLYVWFLSLNPVLLVVGTVRNILLLVVFGWAISVLVQLAKLGNPDDDDPSSAAHDWPTAAWPLGR